MPPSSERAAPPGPAASAGSDPLKAELLRQVRALRAGRASLPDALDCVERAALVDGIARARGNVLEAAKLLGISRRHAHHLIGKHSLARTVDRLRVA